MNNTVIGTTPPVFKGKTQKLEVTQFFFISLQINAMNNFEVVHFEKIYLLKEMSISIQVKEDTRQSCIFFSKLFFFPHGF